MIFLDWEGRNYQPEDWQADKTQILTALGKHVWVGQYDVGLLIANSIPEKASFLKVTILRKGKTEFDTLDLTNEKNMLWEEILDFSKIEEFHPEWFE